MICSNGERSGAVSDGEGEDETSGVDVLDEDEDGIEGRKIGAVATSGECGCNVHTPH